MTGPSRPVLRLVPDAPDDGQHDPVDALTADDGTPASPAARPDPSDLRAAIDAAVAHLAAIPGRHADELTARWDAVRALTDPADLARLAAHATSVTEAAETVRRQHIETAEDLGPLWDTWAGPAAEAVQNRVSALARSAHALVLELESTAGRLSDAHDRIVDALETLADDLDDGTTPADPLDACDRAADACRAGWADARRVLEPGDGGPDPDGVRPP